ncbi:MAG: ATP-grasp domain-containing protein [Leptothrix sp. (in: b-proteobacteria)]
MAHLLIIELPGGNDIDILLAAQQRGDTVCFLSADLGHYRAQPAVWASIKALHTRIEVPGFDDAEVLRQVRAAHARRRFDALLCLVDIRLVEAARLAQALSLRHITPDTAALLRDKSRVRQRLAEAGLAGDDYAWAESNAELRAAVERLGLPVLIKPVDGYGSQNIIALHHADELEPWLTPLDDLIPCRADYGLGVHASDRWLVERFHHGQLFGCDVFSRDGRHTLIGVHEKLMFEPPSFAMRGSTFCPRSPAHDAIAACVGRWLDAVGFDHGACHVELMLTQAGPRLVEINGRLVGARIARLASLTLGRSLHAELIALHAGEPDPIEAAPAASTVGVIRWIVSERHGVLAGVDLPVDGAAGASDAPRIRCIEMLKHAGDAVRVPLENADRIGYVMASGASRPAVEALADDHVAAVRLRFADAAPGSAR